jgi:hypothetical protein
MARVLDTLLAYLLGGKYAGLQRDDSSRFALLDLQSSSTQRTGLRLGYKLDTRQRASFLDGCPNNLSR